MSRVIVAAILALGFGNFHAVAQSTAPILEQGPRLAACIAKIETDPDGAYEDGLAWMGIGATRPARHCTALALVGLKRYAEAAGRLEILANDVDGGTLADRAVYLAQAGNAWMLAHNPEAALVALSNAIKLAPEETSLRKDRARAHMLLEDWDAAGKELDVAIKMSVGDAEALRLRAKALLEMDRLDDAWSDIRHSLDQDPNSVEALVLRGDIREAMRLKGMPDPVQG